MLSVLLSNWKTILIGLLLLYCTGTYFYMSHKIDNLSAENKVLIANAEKLEKALVDANKSIQTCTDGKDALQTEIKSLNIINTKELENCQKANTIFKDAINVAVKADQVTDNKKKKDTKVKTSPNKDSFTVMSKEKSSDVIKLYNEIWAPFIKE